MTKEPSCPIGDGLLARMEMERECVGGVAAGVHAEVSVGGGLSGQVGIGSNILQIGSVHGDVVTVAPAGTITELVPRPSPVKVIPREPEPFFGREAEAAFLVAEALAGRAIAVEGPQGIGRSTLLRRVATDSGLGPVAFLSRLGTSLDDAGQILVDHFYRSDVPVRPTSAQARSLLQQVEATIIIDDVDRDVLGGLIDLAPNCGFVVAPSSSGTDLRPIVIGGLAADEARSLFAYSLGRPLRPDERTAADRLCVYAANSPTRIIATAAMAQTAGKPLEAFADEIWTSGVSSSPSPTDSDTRLLDLLGAIPNLIMPESWLSTLAYLSDIGEGLRPWIAAGLVREAPDGGFHLTEKRSVSDTVRAAVVAHAVDVALVGHGRISRADPITAALNAVLVDCTQHGDWQSVLDIGAALDPVYAQSGRWDAWRDVLAPMLTAARALGNRAAEARVLHQLGTRELCLLGGGAAGLLAVALRIRQTIGDTAGAAATQHNIAAIPPPPISSPSPDVQRPHPQPRQHPRPRPRLRTAATAATAVMITLATTVTIVLTNSSPSVAFTAEKVGFSAQPVSAPGPVETATLINNGSASARITAPRIDGGNATDFGIISTTCGDELPAGGSCETAVAFTPTAEGIRTGLLAVELEGGPGTSVSLTGAGTHPTGLVVNPTTIVFPVVATRAIAQSATITVTHPDPGSTTVQTVGFDIGPAAAEFALANDTCTGHAITSQDHCTVDVTFTPKGTDEPITHVRFLGTDGTLASVPVNGTITHHATTPPTTKPGDIPPAGGPPAVVVKVIVPPVVGKPSNAAASTLTAIGLRVGTTSQTPGNSAVGTVISSNPTAGTTVPPGTSVALVISSGPRTCQVPDVTGMTVSAATSAIKATCAVVGTVTTESADAAPNTVLRTSPSSGSKVTDGSSVQLIVAKADGVLVPSVIGQSRLDAKATLEAAGLALGPYTPTNDDNESPAISQQPAAGQRVLAGTSVTVTFQSIPPTVEPR